MKRMIIIACLVGSMAIFLDSINAGHALLLFVFVGIIPGTDVAIAPVDMLAAIATAITVIIFRLTLWNRTRTLLFAAPTSTRSKRSLRHIS